MQETTAHALDAKQKPKSGPKPRPLNHKGAGKFDAETTSTKPDRDGTVQ